MKVGFVIDDSLDSTDGVQQYVLNLGNWMTRKGIEVHYLCGSSKRDDINSVHSLSSKVPVRFNKNKLTIPLPSSSRKIRRLLIQEDFDVLHVQMPYSPMLASRVIQLSPEKTVIVGTFHIAPYSKFHQSATSILGYMLKPNLRMFDDYFAVSKAAQMTANKSFKINSKIIPNVVDYSLVKVGRNTNTKKDIVFLGRLVNRKGCIELLKGYKYLIEKNVNDIGNLIIAGSGPDEDKIKNYIIKHRLSNKVKLLGRVSEDRKYQILSSAKIAIFPSKSGESFGIVLLEAMAAGAEIVLGGNNPGYSEVLKSDDYLFNPRDPKSIADKIEKYYNSDNRKEHKIQQEIVKKYDIDLVAPKIVNIYKALIAKKALAIHNNH